VLIAGGLSRITISAVIPGLFPRELSHKVYGPRRLYALCWTSVFYFTPLYYLCVSFSFLKNFLFRLFGYKGQLDFTIAPDVWTRDLPLLNLESKAYVANKCTLGTNICLSNNKTLVGQVSIGKGSMVGHMSMIAPGVVLGDNVDLGVGNAVGIRTRIDSKTHAGPVVSIHHGVHIKENVEIGACSYVGLRAVIGPNIKLPAGANIPAGAVIEQQADVDQYFSSESRILQETRLKTAASLFDVTDTVRGPDKKLSR
jgi:UDP-3-O-[3-hydroxymyristoyl] glucosamine N-acyltransferase